MTRGSIWAAALLLVCSHAAEASPETDAQYLADRLMSHNPQFFEGAVRGAHVVAYSALLDERSVKIRDRARMAELFPDEMIERHLESVRKLMVDQMLIDFKPETLEGLVAYLDAEIAAADDMLPLPLASDDVSANVDENRDDLQHRRYLLDGPSAMALTMQMVGAVVRIQYDAKVIPDLNAPFVADMLETEDVFQFPNPIYRRDLIREARGGMR